MVDTNPYEKISVINWSFWDLWIQKVFRNIASVKYQWLLFLYIPTIWGMFHLKPAVAPATVGEPWISAAIGLGFLGGGFVTLAVSRLIANTSLKESEEQEERVLKGGSLDTDK